MTSYWHLLSWCRQRTCCSQQSAGARISTRQQCQQTAPRRARAPRRLCVQQQGAQTCLGPRALGLPSRSPRSKCARIPQACRALLLRCSGEIVVHGFSNPPSPRGRGSPQKCARAKEIACGVRAAACKQVARPQSLTSCWHLSILDTLQSGKLQTPACLCAFPRPAHPPSLCPHFQAHQPRLHRRHQTENTMSQRLTLPQQPCLAHPRTWPRP